MQMKRGKLCWTQKWFFPEEALVTSLGTMSLENYSLVGEGQFSGSLVNDSLAGGSLVEVAALEDAFR